MAYVEDRWTATSPAGRKIKSERHGTGMRWLAHWTENSARRAKAFSTQDAAKQHLAKVDVDKRAGTHIVSSKATVREYGDQWVRMQIHQRGSTREQMESRWRLHIAPALGDLKLSEVTRASVQSAVVKWSEVLAPSTVAVTYAYLTGMMKAAAADRLIRETPCRDIRLPKDEREKVIPLTVAQVHTIARRIGERYRAMVILGAATGMRSGELRGLTVDRLLFGDELLKVRVDRQLVTSAPRWGPPKTLKSDRSITVGGATAEAMKWHLTNFPPHPTGLVFTGRAGGPLARNSAAAAWDVGTAGMTLKERSGWHDLRHFHASLLIAAGLSVVAVADRLGHQDSTETLRTYAHLWADDEDRARSAVEGALWSTGSGVNEIYRQPQNNRLSIVAGQSGF